MSCRGGNSQKAPVILLNSGGVFLVFQSQSAAQYQQLFPMFLDFPQWALRDSGETRYDVDDNQRQESGGWDVWIFFSYNGLCTLVT